MKLYSFFLNHIIKFNSKICSVCKYKGKRNTAMKEEGRKCRKHKENITKENKP